MTLSRHLSKQLVYVTPFIEATSIFHAVYRIKCVYTYISRQVECCIGAENMVEKLTDSNLELEEKMVTMASELSDLEALRDCYEELEEERMATERELREVPFKILLGGIHCTVLLTF